MKFNRSQLNSAKNIFLEDDLNFANVDFSNRKPLLGFKSVHATADIFSSDKIIEVNFALSGVAIMECAYTLSEVEVPFNFTEQVDLSDDEEIDDPNAILAKGNNIDLAPIALELIAGELPSKVIKKGAKLPKNGKGYRVLTEDELRKERENNNSSPFDCLKDLDL